MIEIPARPKRGINGAERSGYLRGLRAASAVLERTWLSADRADRADRADGRTTAGHRRAGLLAAHLMIEDMVALRANEVDIPRLLSDAVARLREDIIGLGKATSRAEAALSDRIDESRRHTVRDVMITQSLGEQIGELAARLDAIDRKVDHHVELLSARVRQLEYPRECEAIADEHEAGYKRGQREAAREIVERLRGTSARESGVDGSTLIADWIDREYCGDGD